MNSYWLLYLFLWSVTVHWTQQIQLNNFLNDGRRRRNEANPTWEISKSFIRSSVLVLYASTTKVFNLTSKGKVIIFVSTVKSFEPPLQAQAKPRCIRCPKSRVWFRSSFLYAVLWRTCGCSCSCYRVVDNKVRPVCLLWLLLSSD